MTHSEAIDQLDAIANKAGDISGYIDSLNAPDDLVSDVVREGIEDVKARLQNVDNEVHT